MILIYPSHHFAPDLHEHIATEDEVIHASDQEDFEDHLPDADIVLTNRWSHDWDSHLEDIDFIQITSAGYDHMPVETFLEHDVAVANASGVHAEPIAEHVLAYLLGLERRTLTSYEAQKEREWLDWGKTFPGELAGSTLAVVGVGAIGSEIARKAQAFEMEVIGIDPDPDETTHLDESRGPGDLGGALGKADAVVLACPLTEETRGMIGAEELDQMPEDAALINIARGAVIEEQALLETLQDDGIGVAVLDVTWEEPLPEDSPFWGLPNCLITPHIAGLSPRYGERMAALFQRNLHALRSGGEMPTGIGR